MTTASSSSHLTAERLALLADEAPMPAELAHLALCAACAGERRAYEALLDLTAQAFATAGGAAPLTSWDLLRDAWAQEPRDAGTPLTPAVLRSLELARPVRGAERWSAGRAVRAWRKPAALGRAAAALLLLAAGVTAGRWSAGDGVSVAPTRQLATASDLLAAPGGGGLASVARAVADSLPVFRSTTEALIALARAEREYQLAAAYLMGGDSAGGTAVGPAIAPEVYRTRLAALDNVMAASRQALYEAPHDPVINRYYLATVASREATLQQLNTALPTGQRLTRF